MQTPEILAPAGNREQLIAAVQTGCDDVYLGMNVFSARAGAGNFTRKDIGEVIDYCHEYGVRVYVAINTLLKDVEVLAAVELASDLWAKGVDALIVTDPGLISELRRRPDIELHASTQTSIHHPDQAKFYRSVGIQRAILARELSAPEIRAISDVIESEIFIQGALCISYSGQCLMSSMFGGRSGNRGRCAQPCRLTYQLKEGEKRSETSHRLSPKDLSLLPRMDSILSLGVASLKIEGRLRSPAYVMEAIKAYRDALNGKRTSLRGLERTFNRGGYTQEYIDGRASHAMMARETPKHQGRFVAVAAKPMELQEDIRVGDGITTGAEGFRIEAIRQAGRSVLTARAGDTVEILPRKYTDGQLLYKNLDSALQERAEQVIREPYGRKMILPVQVRFIPGEPIRLTTDGMILEGDLVQEAVNAPLDRSRIVTALEKSGETAFRLEASFEDYQPGFVSIGALNQVRRQLVDQVVERTRIRRDRPVVTMERPTYSVRELPEKLIEVRQKNHLPLLAPGDIVCLNPFYQEKGSLDRNDVEQWNGSFFLHVPTILRTEYRETIDWIKGLPNCIGIVTANVAALAELHHLSRIGDRKLNLMNSLGADLYQVDGYEPSEELNRMELAKLSNMDRVVMNLYGRTELMLTDYCQTRTGYPCRRPCRHQPISLVDRMGEEIPVSRDIFCRSHLLNPKRKNLLGLSAEIKQLGIRHFSIQLTNETQEEAEMILQAFRTGQDVILEQVTYGHYRRGVE